MPFRRAASQLARRRWRISTRSSRVDRALVVNASPLILLARIDRLDLLASLAKLLVVPEAVIRELQAGSDRDETAGKVKALPSILQVDDRPVPDRIRSWDL